MTPDQLAKSGSEHGEQRALFAWAMMAEAYGFEIANDDRAYGVEREVLLLGSWVQPAVELHWLHAIPNGGFRDKATAGKLKAEGVKRGIPDIFLPLPMKEPDPHPERNYLISPLRPMQFAGLYIEMKRAETLKVGVRKALIVDRKAGTTSEDQDAFAGYARKAGYAVGVCFDWRSAAKDIETYIRAVRTNA